MRDPYGVMVDLDTGQVLGSATLRQLRYAARLLAEDP